MSIIYELAKDLGLAPKDILLIAKTAPYRYKEFRIPKKKPGTFRQIAQPAREVKILQRWIVENVINKLPIHDSATAYIEGRNIAFNAKQHSLNPFLLKMDFKDFFPSIIPNDFENHMRKFLPGIYDAELELLSRILFWKNSQGTMQLSIGGPSSPSLSNTIMYEFDSMINSECNTLGVSYSRYADDLAFSAQDFDKLRLIQEKVSNVLNKISYPRLRINTDKTVFLSKKGNRTVTGVVITNEGNTSLGRDRKRLISCQINYFKKGMLNRESILKLRGMLCFANDIEPIFIERMKSKYSMNTIQEIIHYDTYVSINK